MIFSYTKTIDTPGFECEKTVFLFYGDEDNEVSITAVDAINDRNAIEKLRAGGIDAKFAVLPGSNVPVVIIPDGLGTQVTKIYEQVTEFLRKSTDEKVQLPVLASVRDKLATQLGKNSATTLISAIKVQYDWETNGKLTAPLVLDASDLDLDFRARTMKMLEENNNQFVRAITSIDPADNYTRFQETCSSELFIAIPDRRVLLDDVSLLTVLPKRDEVCVPYHDDAAYTPDYAIKGVPSYMFPLIEGVKENNGAPVYENESKYRQALLEWVQFNMREEFGSTDGNVIDLLSQQYLFALMTNFYMWHWGHNPCVPESVSDMSLGDDNDESLSQYAFRAGSGVPQYNAVIMLQEFLKGASAQLGYEVFIDAVIQIARWGERKPTRITFDGYDREFDLGTGLIKHKIGDISEYSVVKVDGRDSKLVALIYDDARIQDASIPYKSWEFPVGIATQTTMRNEAGDTVDLLRYVHCIDIIDLMQNGELSVLGIEKNGTNWDIDENSLKHYAVSELIKDYDMRKDSLLQFPFYRGQKLKDDFIELQANSARMPANLFSIMSTRVADPNLKKNADKVVFNNRDEMYQLIVDGVVTSVVTAAELSIVRKVLPQYEAVAAKSPNTLAETLTVWEKIIADENEKTLSDKVTSNSVKPVNSFGETAKSVDQSSMSSPVPESTEQTNIAVNSAENVQSTRSAISASGADNAGEGVTRENTDKTFSWIKIVPTDAKLKKVINSNNDVLFYCSVEALPMPNKPNKTYLRYTVVSESNINGREIEEAQPLMIERIFALLLHNIYLNESSGSGIGQVFFDSVGTIAECRNKLQSIVKARKDG